MRNVLFLLLLIPVAANAVTHDVMRFGAKGDGKADDTAAIQACIDRANTGDTVVFSDGTFLLTSVRLKPGLTYLGRGGILKRPPKQDKWVRTLTCTEYSSDVDSALTRLVTLSFDGSRADQGAFNKYELEQAHLLFLSADPKRKGRLRVEIDGCDFRESVADGISVFTNVVARITDCSSYNCFRGGFVLTGGHSQVTLRNFTSDGTSDSAGIDIEIDGAGYKNSLATQVVMEGLRLYDGHFDIAVGAGSNVRVNNVYSKSGFYLAAPNSSVLISNGAFGVGERSDEWNRIVFPGNTEFRNCVFTLVKTGAPSPMGWAAIHLFWNISGTSYKGQSLKFTECSFRGPRIPADAERTALYVQACDPSEGMLALTRCSIMGTFGVGVYLRDGGSVHVERTRLAAGTTFLLGDAGSGNLSQITVVNSLVADGTVYLQAQSAGKRLNLSHKNVTLNNAQNVLKLEGDPGKIRVSGGRTILGASPPTADTPGLLGDVYLQRRTRKRWIYTRRGPTEIARWIPN